MATLNLQNIIDATDTEYEVVHTDEWAPGSTVRLGSLDAASYDAWLERNGEIKLRQAAFELIARSLVDDDGKRLVDAEDVAGLVALANSLQKRDARVITRLKNAVLKMNGLTGPGAAEIKNALSEAKSDASPSA